jgi:hypothetical protein
MTRRAAEPVGLVLNDIFSLVPRRRQSVAMARHRYQPPHPDPCRRGALSDRGSRGDVGMERQRQRPRTPPLTDPWPHFAQVAGGKT